MISQAERMMCFIACLMPFSYALERVHDQRMKGKRGSVDIEWTTGEPQVLINTYNTWLTREHPLHSMHSVYFRKYSYTYDIL